MYLATLKWFKPMLAGSTILIILVEEPFPWNLENPCDLQFSIEILGLNLLALAFLKSSLLELESVFVPFTSLGFLSLFEEQYCMKYYNYPVHSNVQ